ncbi:MAG: ribosome-associated translation inhibitor RaiA [Phycisphaerales bacterium]|nr:MAG: ribosome-associated translation inhibitor RaiA [Phycisphaerales bacterium]
MPIQHREMFVQIEINYRNMDKTDAINAHIEQELEAAIGRFADRLTRVEVHLSDENAGKSGPDDKRVMFEARPRGMDPLVVEAKDEDMYKAISDAAGKLRRILTTRFEKADAF